MMSTVSILIASLASSATAAGLTALYFRSRLNALTLSEATFKAWWEKDSARAIVAEAKIDLIRQQHVDAGKKAHEPWKALRRETTEKLMRCVVNRDNPPSTSEPVPGFPAGAQRPEKTTERPISRRSGRQDGGEASPRNPAAKGRHFGRLKLPAQPRGNSAPAEFTQAEGAI